MGFCYLLPILFSFQLKSHVQPPKIGNGVGCDPTSSESVVTLPLCGG